MPETTIGWCTHSWNLLRWWCTKHSEGCKNCYMLEMAKEHPKNAADEAVVRPNAWKELRSFPSGAVVFAGDMYDWMHERMPHDIIRQHLQAAQSRPDCEFLFLTKRVERLAETFSILPIPPNVWFGVSIENQKRLYRLDLLRSINHFKKFVSVEPLLEGLGDVEWDGVDGVIVGGESGGNKRPFDKNWARVIRDQCAARDIAYYFKQGSAYSPGQDRLLDGRTHDATAWQMPSGAVEEDVQQGLF